MTSTQSYISHIWVPLPPVSVVGECGKLWERTGLAVDAATLKQPDGELVGRRGCKENKKRRESRVPCSHRVPAPTALGELPDPSLCTEGFLIPRTGHTKRGLRVQLCPRATKLLPLFHFLQLWRHLPSLGSTQWLSNLFPKLKNWS